MYLLFHWYNITETQRKQGMHPELHKKLMTEAEIESTFGLKTLCSFAHITHFPNCIPLKYMWMLLFILYTWITWIWIFYFKCCQLSKSETSAQITRKKVTVLSALAWKLSFSTICRINYHLFLLSHIVSLTLLPCIEVCTQCL